MGLLGKFLGAPPAKKATDDVLLLLAMMMMSSADGVLEASEIASLEQFINTLPEFKGPDFPRQMEAARKLQSKYKTPKDAVKALAEISSETVKKKVFVLAADIAMASGEVDAAEEELLEAMQRVLGIDDNLANSIVQVLALKYQS
jgi:tellurite resistance protein